MQIAEAEVHRIDGMLAAVVGVPKVGLLLGEDAERALVVAVEGEGQTGADEAAIRDA